MDLHIRIIQPKNADFLTDSEVCSKKLLINPYLPSDLNANYLGFHIYNILDTCQNQVVEHPT